MFVDFWKVLKLLNLLSPLSPWGKTLLAIVLVDAFLLGRRRYSSKVNDGYIDILKKKTGQIFLFKRSDVNLIIQQHLSRYFLDS